MKLPVPSFPPRLANEASKKPSAFGITKNKLPKLHLDTLQLQFTVSRASPGIISKWITMIYFWFQSSTEHNLPVEWEKERPGASHIPPAPFQSRNFYAGRHPPTDVQWTRHETGQKLWVLVSLESMTLKIKPLTGLTLQYLRNAQTTIYIWGNPKAFATEGRRATSLKCISQNISMY